MRDIDLDYHAFVSSGPRGYPCKVCGVDEYDSRHDVDEDDEVLGLAWVLQRERERKKFTMTCECGWSTHDAGLMKLHTCHEEDEGNGFHVDYPACGCEYGDCFGKKYGSDESIKAFHVDLLNSGMADYEIDAFYERMDGGY